jgi:uncharacterized protein YegJ (DUF2314 family)
MSRIEDEIVPVAACNDEMAEAIEQARASFGDFLKAFREPKPNQTGFHVKARFDEGEGEGAEHLWLADISFKEKIATGVVMNEPRIESVHYLERVPFLPDQISDWMYMEDGKMIGGFTTKVLLKAKFKPGGFRELLKHKLKM